MRVSYMDYAMSVIIGRALPDVRDGLKPVHRRVLYTMNDLKNNWNSSYKKSARIVGDCIGKYHPHGDQAVYDTLVRLAQDFDALPPCRWTRQFWFGGWRSCCGDAVHRGSHAAHRAEMLADIDKDTVEFGSNYDETTKEPLVMPTRIPNLLVNGSAGIAVGMATNIPPHNLREVVDGAIAVMRHPQISLPNCLRLFRRRIFQQGAPSTAAAAFTMPTRPARCDSNSRGLRHRGNDSRP